MSAPLNPVEQLLAAPAAPSIVDQLADMLGTTSAPPIAAPRNNGQISQRFVEEAAGPVSQVRTIADIVWEPDWLETVTDRELVAHGVAMGPPMLMRLTALRRWSGPRHGWDDATHTLHERYRKREKAERTAGTPPWLEDWYRDHEEKMAVHVAVFSALPNLTPEESRAMAFDKVGERPTAPPSPFDPRPNEKEWQTEARLRPLVHTDYVVPDHRLVTHRPTARLLLRDARVLEKLRRTAAKEQRAKLRDEVEDLRAEERALKRLSPDSADAKKIRASRIARLGRIRFNKTWAQRAREDEDWLLAHPSAQWPRAARHPCATTPMAARAHNPHNDLRLIVRDEGEVD